MWETLITLLIGAAIPLIIQRLQSKEKKKFFELEHKEKLKLTALDKRLEAHQKTYAFCMHALDKMFSNDEESIKHIYQEGLIIMENYSLYLESGTRKKMVESLGFLRAYCPKNKYISEFNPSDQKKEIERFHKESKKVFELADIVQKEVELEPISLKFDAK